MNGRIPFFYEPNFDALIEPLPSALALQGHTDEERKKSVIYGDFLRSKVSGNFAADVSSSAV